MFRRMPRAALARHLDAGRGKPGRAHILDRHDRVGRHQFETGLDQQLFGKRIADLDGRALFVRILVEFSAGHGRAVNPVASGLAADIDDRIAEPSGGGVKDFRLVGHAHSHRIDKDVAVVRGVEIGLATYRGHAHAVAVAADSRDHALHQVFHPGVAGPAEAQRVEVGNRPRAHREHVAKNPADAGRRALVGFDIAGVIMALHLEDAGQLRAVRTFADVDHPGVLARTANHPGRLRGQFLKMQARAFVAAMLGPHHRENAQLDHVGHTPQRLQDVAVLIRRQAMRGDDFGGDFGRSLVHRRALAGRGTQG